MSPSALLGGSFLAGAGSGEDTHKVSIRRHTLHPSSHHHLLDPRPLLPDTTVPPGEGQRSAPSQKQLWQCLHTKREFRGDAGALEGSQKE